METHIHIKSNLNTPAIERLNYVIDFLNNHPLKPKNIQLSSATPHPPSTIIDYGSATGSSWEIPLQNFFFGISRQDQKSFYTNQYFYKENIIYDVSPVKKEHQAAIKNRRFSFDIFETIFFHISRFEEFFADEHQIDSSGWLKESEHILVKNNIYHIPVVDELVKFFFETITGKNISKKTTFSITHDIDVLARFTPFYKFLKSLLATLFYRRGIQQLSNSIRYYVKMINKDYPDPYNYFEQLFRKEDFWKRKEIYLMSGGNSKFDNHYKLDDKQISSIIQTAKKRGYQIGIHPSYNAGFSEKMYQEEYETLSKKLDEKVCINRQHWLRFSWKITPKIWSRQGIQSDSSMGFNRYLGFRCGTGFPYFMYDFKNETSFEWKEYPMTFMESSAIHFARNNGEELASVMKNFLEQNLYNTHITFNFHNSNFDPLLKTGRILRTFYEDELINLIDA